MKPGAALLLLAAVLVTTSAWGQVAKASAVIPAGNPRPTVKIAQGLLLGDAPSSESQRSVPAGKTGPATLQLGLPAPLDGN